MAVSLAACSDAPAKPQRAAPVLRLETKVIDQNEKFHILEVPDGRHSSRCVTYVNTELKQSHMQCDFQASPTVDVYN